MNSFKKIAGINLAVLLIYSLLIRLANHGSGRNEDYLGIMIVSAVAVGLHVLVCFIVMLWNYSSNDREAGRAWLASTGLVLLVGFSVCLGNATL